ncbi:MAG TPA: Holliday junction branch migration protein RuvA [Candidatus Nanopelagicales bacterium]
MIAFVRGRVAALSPDVAVVEVGGVGLEVVCGPGTLAALRVGHEATLATALVVREDSLTLFGFADEDERVVFGLLQTVSGVGPRLAQAALSVHRPDELRRAVATDNLVALMKVPGVGRKGAQRIVLELKDRLGPPRGSGTTEPSSPTDADWQSQVRAGLLGLGWNSRDADAAVAQVAPESGAEPDVAALLRAALRSLDRS